MCIGSKEMKIALLTLSILSLLHSSVAANLADGDELFAKAKYDSAYLSYRKAAQTFYVNKDYYNYLVAHLGMIDCQLEIGEPREALQLGKSSLEFLKNNIVSNHLNARILIRIGESNIRLGHVNEAILSFEEASKLCENESLALAECYENLGIAFWNQENLELAKSYHDRALQIRKSYPKSAESDMLIADSYTNLGLLYMESEAILGMSFFEKSLSAYGDHLPEFHPKRALLLTNMAFASAGMKQYDAALSYLDRIDQQWDVLYPGVHPNKALAKNNRGRILKQKGDLQGAVVLFQEALKIYHHIHGNKHPELANTYFLLAEVVLSMDDYKSALEYYQKSIYSNISNQSFQSLYDLPALNNYYNAKILLYSLQAKAGALEAYFFRKSLKIGDIEGALATYELCAKLIDDMRRARVSEHDKLRLAATAHDIYTSAIEACYYLSKHTFRKNDYLEIAYRFCEMNKSSILHEAIQDSNAKEFGGVPSVELALEDSLNAEIGYLELEIAQTQSDEKLVVLKDKLFNYKTALLNYTKRLEENYPNYYSLKYDNESVDIEKLKQLLPEDVCLLTYFLSEDRVFVYMISQKGLSLESKPFDGDMTRIIKGLRNAIKYRDDQTLKDYSKRLCDILIPDIDNKIKKIVIIPDGELSTLPYEVLTLSNKKTSKYLIEDFSVAYEYSAKLFYQRLTQNRSGRADKGSLLLMAPIHFEGMSDLSHSTIEAKEIDLLFRGDEWNTTVLLNEKASESFLKSMSATRYDYIHLATHGIVNESEPNLSKVFLSADGQNDGQLFAREIYGLNLNANMISLSACETGLGKIAKGEGVVGLSRALMYAGAKNIVVSLWPVSDISTSRFMIDYYDHHLYRSHDDTFADDLRAAKLNLIKSTDYSEPYYWAPFILIGI